MNETRVDFSYAFATPHRLTVARPDSSDKTLLDVQAGSVRMAWSFDSLVRFPLCIYAWPVTNWDFTLKPEIDDKPFGRSSWNRLERTLPVLDNVYSDIRGTVRLQIAGGETAAIGKITLINTGDQSHRFTFTCAAQASFAAGYNPGWVDEKEYIDTILAGHKERADQVIVLALGAEAYEMPAHAAVRMAWTLQPGQCVTGWLIRPYQAFKAEIPALRRYDWQKEFDQAIEEWKKLLAKAEKIRIPDPGVRDGFLACFADFFIMREPVAQGYVAGTAGTETYRWPLCGEPAIQAICMDQFGFHREAQAGFQMCLDLQGEDGDWADPMGLANHWWAASGFKSWAVMEHYRLTKDRTYLEKVFPRMLASSRFQDRQRAKTRTMVNGERPLTYGLMPRGMGDCGLFDGEDYYGVFYPHNFWSAFADGCSAEAAMILNRPEYSELQDIYARAKKDLLESLEQGAIQEEGFRWIPGTPGKTTGSCWGALNALFPCKLLPADHELINGTIRKMEMQMSPGGIPVHTGWMKDGMWVAITLDNLAQAHLVRGNGDIVAEYLYAVLNHGTPLYTWCEERGQEPGSAKISGDRQHLFTPVAVVRTIRDSLVMEESNGLNLGIGTARSWLASGQPVGIEDAPTYFGAISYRMQYDLSTAKVTGYVKFPASDGPTWARLHIRLPKGLKVKSVNPDARATILPDGNGLYFKLPKGDIKIEALIG